MKKTLFLTVIALMMTATLALTGCGVENHKVTEGEPCGECHADDKEETAQGAVEPAFVVGTEFSVETSADKVWLCLLRFGGEGGTHLIPTRLKTLGNADLSTVHISEPGWYALCFGNMEAPETVVIKADSSVEPGSVVRL